MTTRKRKPLQPAPEGLAADRRWHRAQIRLLETLTPRPGLEEEVAEAIAYHQQRVEELNRRIAGRRVDGPV